MRWLFDVRLVWAVFLGLAACLYGLVALVHPATEMVRVRNSFIATVGTVDDFDWRPDNPPAQFVNESAPVPDLIAQAAPRIRANARTEPAYVALVKHLRSKPKQKGPIQSSTTEAYRLITGDGRGYCADYTQVFNGLAYALHLPVREWGMSFDDFGGDGHAFNEIWDEALQQWVFVDTFRGFYVEDPQSGRPLSALEFRNLLRAGGASADGRIVPIGTAFRFDSPDAALDYYRKGADQFYLWFANDVFSYDNDPLVHALSGKSRALEQIAAILKGIHPRIRIIQSETNGPAIASLYRLRTEFEILTVAVLLLSVLFATQCIVLLSRRRPGNSRRSPQPVVRNGPARPIS